MSKFLWDFWYLYAHRPYIQRIDDFNTNASVLPSIAEAQAKAGMSKEAVSTTQKVELDFFRVRALTAIVHRLD